MRNLEGVLYWDFWGDMKEGSGNGASLINLTWVPFLDSDYVRNLSLGATWNFSEGPGLP